MNLSDCKEILLKTHLDSLERNERAIGIVLESGPGLGKTNVAGFEYPSDLCKILNKPVGMTREMLATITSADVRGFMIPVKSPVAGELPQTVFSLPPWFPTRQNTYVFVPDKRAPNGVRIYEPGTWDGDLPDVGVLFLDELGQAEDEVKKPAAELILNGQVGTTRLPSGWRVVAATNRVSDRSGVMRELMFLVNRRLLLKITGEVKPWAEWATSNDVHEMVITFAESHPTIVFRDTVPDGDQPFCTPRSLVMTDRVLRALRSPEDVEADVLPMSDLAREAASGLIGEGAAGQFYAHMRFFGQLPTLEEIEENPEAAKLPAGKDGQMVVVFMLARRVTEENSSSIIIYISRMGAEMQIAALNIFNSNPKAQKILLLTREYKTLIMRHKDVLRASET
jgi:hypothetical protein